MDWVFEPNINAPGDYVVPFEWQHEEDNFVPFHPGTFGMERAGGGVFRETGYKKRPRPTNPVAKALATKQRAVVRRYVKTCMKREAEVKHSTTNESFTPAAGGTAGTSLMATTNGTTSVTRVGNQVQVSMVNFKIYLQLPAASGGDIVRAILVWDHAPNGAACTIGDVLESSNVNSAYNMDKVGGIGHGPSRFTVVADIFAVLNPTSSVVVGGTGAVFKTFHANRKVDVPVHYNGGAGSVADLVKNNLQWVTCSLAASAVFNVKTQVCYIDV